MSNANDELKKNNYNQLCLWAGITVGENAQLFEDYVRDEFGFRVKYETEVITKPDIEDGELVDGTGGRIDLLFYIHDGDISKFAFQRFKIGHIRWWEDVVSYNDGSHLYTKNILKKYEVKW